MRSGYFYMVRRFIHSSVSTHTLIPSPYLLLYPLTGASRVTHMLTLNEIEDTTLRCAVPWNTSSSEPPPCISNIQKGTPALVLFSCVAVLFTSGPLARPCFGFFKQVSKKAYILQARALSLLQAPDKHIKHIKHIQDLINGLRHEGDRCGHRACALHCACYVLRVCFHPLTLRPS